MSDKLLTPLSSFNQLMQALETHTLDEVEAQVINLERDLAGMLTHFNYEVRFARSTPTLQAALPRVYRQFNRLLELFPEVSEKVEAGDFEGLRDLLAGPVRRGLELLFEAFGELRDEEAAREKLSDSPYVDALLQAGHDFLEEKLSAELLHERLLPLIAEQQRMLTALSAAEPRPEEEEWLAGNAPDLVAMVEELLVSLLELEALLLEAPDQVDEIGEYLDGISQLTDELLEIQQSLAERQATAHLVPCVSCGQRLERSVKVCANCGAAQPTFSTRSQLAGPEVDLRIEETISAVTGPAQPELFARLLGTIEAAEFGRVSARELAEEYRSVWARFQAVRRQLDNLPPVDPSQPERAAQIAELSQNFQTHLDAFGQALDKVSLFLDNGDTALLRVARNELSTAGEGLLALMAGLNQAVSEGQA
ncbi:MAG: hypothetical protein AB7S38_18440 [Vulcanimicrobiota bacterium]